MRGIARGREPLVLRGTPTTFRRRCGKRSCRCASGEPHESPALTYTEDGRTKTKPQTTSGRVTHLRRVAAFGVATGRGMPAGWTQADADVLLRWYAERTRDHRQLAKLLSWSSIFACSGRS